MIFNKDSCCYKCKNFFKEGFPHPLSLDERFTFNKCPFFNIRSSQYTHEQTVFNYDITTASNIQYTQNSSTIGTCSYN